MKIVEPSAKLLAVTPNPEQLIERCGRIAYKSEDKITATSAAAFIEMLLKRGHESVLEHASATILFVTDRGVTHEMVRHRLASYTQESTRYCNYGNEKHGGEITIVQPILDKQSDEDWEASCLTAQVAYLRMIQRGISPQFARSVLPTCLKTEITMTANFREWRHFFKLRCAPSAHPQMQQIAKMALELLWLEAQNVFGDLRKQFNGAANA